MVFQYMTFHKCNNFSSSYALIQNIFQLTEVSSYVSVHFDLLHGVVLLMQYIITCNTNFMINSHRKRA